MVINSQVLSSAENLNYNFHCTLLWIINFCTKVQLMHHKSFPPEIIRVIFKFLCHKTNSEVIPRGVINTWAQQECLDLLWNMSSYLYMKIGLVHCVVFQIFSTWICEVSLVFCFFHFSLYSTLFHMRVSFVGSGNRTIFSETGNFSIYMEIKALRCNSNLNTNLVKNRVSTFTLLSMLFLFSWKTQREY